MLEQLLYLFYPQIKKVQLQNKKVNFKLKTLKFKLTKAEFQIKILLVQKDYQFANKQMNKKYNQGQIIIN